GESFGDLLEAGVGGEQRGDGHGGLLPRRAHPVTLRGHAPLRTVMLQPASPVRSKATTSWPSSAAHWGRESVAWVQSKPMIRSSPADSCCIAFFASISGKGHTSPLVSRV